MAVCQRISPTYMYTAHATRLHSNSEEQHDDQLLTELLRCIKAVETAEVGLLMALYGKLTSLTWLRHSK